MNEILSIYSFFDEGDCVMGEDFMDCSIWGDCETCPYKNEL